MAIRYAKFTTMLEHLLAALYISDSWYWAWFENHDSPCKHHRRLATYGRARAVVMFDRVLNGEMR